MSTEDGLGGVALFAAFLASEKALRTVAALRALVEEKDKALQMLWDYLGRSTNDEDKSFSAGNYEGTY